MNHSIDDGCDAELVAQHAARPERRRLLELRDPDLLPARSAGFSIPRSVRIRTPRVEEPARREHRESPTHSVGAFEVAIVNDEIDISETSNSAWCSWRKNISDGCIAVMSSLIASGVTVPSIAGCESTVGESAHDSLSFATA